MASRARSREAHTGVIGIRCTRVVRLVTRVAVRRHGCVIVVRMTLRAGNVDMGAGQGECARRMIERRRSPAVGGMADRAICRET